MMRHYTEAERQHFAAYVDERARFRPLECCGGLECWVDFGPPAMTTAKSHRCVGCAGAPVMPREARIRGKYRR